MEILDGYTDEEVKQLARAHLESENKIKEENTLKIKEIDKKYKQHNSRAVINAITTGSAIIIMGSILMKSDVNISEFGTENLIGLLDNVTESLVDFIVKLPFGDLAAILYTKMVGGLEFLLEQFGVIGVVLASKSVSFVTNTISDAKKSIKMKKEINALKESLEKSNKKENERENERKK